MVAHLILITSILDTLSLKLLAAEASERPQCHPSQRGLFGMRADHASNCIFKDRFDLTPAEARLVARLMTGESLRSCATAVGIKYETLRGQLKSVFQKTKTHRQAELVTVVIRAMNETNPLPPPASPLARPGS
jgi:DNA-binding CsgD family transcriptional regulator